MTPVQKLYDVLKSFQSILEDIDKALELQRTLIIKLDTPDLEQAGDTLAQLFDKVNKLNPEIIATVAEACKAASVEGEQTIEKLLSTLSKTERELITKLQVSLKKSTVSINSQLSINKSLLSDSIQFSGQSMQIFTNALKQTGSTLYGNQGKFIDAPEQPHIICKEI